MFLCGRKSTDYIFQCFCPVSHQHDILVSTDAEGSLSKKGMIADLVFLTVDLSFYPEPTSFFFFFFLLGVNVRLVLIKWCLSKCVWWRVRSDYHMLKSSSRTSRPGLALRQTAHRIHHEELLPSLHPKKVFVWETFRRFSYIPNYFSIVVLT